MIRWGAADPAPRSRPGVLGWLAWLDAGLRALERAAFETRGLGRVVRRPCARSDAHATATAERVRDAWSDAWERARRSARCGAMLARIAASYRLQQTRSAFVSERRARIELARLHRRSARRFVRTSLESGGAFLKVGQLLSARPDLLPAAWIERLSALQDAAASLPFAVVRRVIEAELGAPFERHFAAFEPVPVAAASIGQVHRARAHDGTLLAVKVQRPGVAALVDADLRLLSQFVGALGASLPRADYGTIVSELDTAIRRELDFAAEADAMERVASLFRDDPPVVVPRPIRALCTARVLAAEWIEGRKITSVLDELRAIAGDAAVAATARKDEILGRLVAAYVRQVLIGGLFQADPHPGNLLVTADDRVVVLDFGCSQALTPAQRLGYLALLQACLGDERARVSELLHELGFATESGDDRTLHVFADALLDELKRTPDEDPQRESTAAVVARLLDALQRDPVLDLPPEFVLLGRVFTTLGGLFAHYEGRLDASRHLLPHLAAALATPAPAERSLPYDEA